MLHDPNGRDLCPTEPEHQEGDLYKVITTFGKTFSLYYGYYEEIDRHSKYAEPTEIYPDFREQPVYTDDGYPFVTAIQPTCPLYEKERDTTDTCADCKHFARGEELFGICTCQKNRKQEST